MKLLTSQEEKLLHQEKILLEEIENFLTEYKLKKEDRQALTASIQQLDELFLLVVVGEFNAGKSAFINALVGEKILKEGVTPTTTRVNILRYGEDKASFQDAENVLYLTSPAPFLQEISIVDTPGTNAIIREHEEITSRFIPRSDLVLFITSADRPFTESERLFLKEIREWKKKVVVVINKIDLLQSSEELEEINQFINTHIKTLLNFNPEIFPLSARQAYLAKEGEGQLWETSRFQYLEDYLFQTLNETSRLKLKLLNPLGVAKNLTAGYQEHYEHQLKVLEEDFALLQDVENQLDLYHQDMLESFQLRLSAIDGLLVEMENRGLKYFEEHLRLVRIFDLLNKDRIQNAFEEQVIGDVPQQIEKRITRIIDWIVDANLRQWQAITDHLANSRQQHQGRIMDEVTGYNYDRERYINSILQGAQKVIASYDQDQEAYRIADQAQKAVAATAAIEAGAIGLGTIVSILATTAAADVTGILIASMMAALGFIIIPNRRRKAKQEMRQKIGEMREQLTTSLETHFRNEIDHSLQDIKDTFAPYSRFVRTEREHNLKTLDQVESYQQQLIALTAEVKKIDDTS